MVVKKAKRIPPSILPLVIFEEMLWISLLGAVVLIFVFWSIMRYVLKQQIKRFCMASRFSKNAEFVANKKIFNLTNSLAGRPFIYQIMQLFVDTLMLIMSAPMRRFTKSQNERIFITSICLFSMIFVSIYQSSLAGVFITPIYYKDINNMQQLDESGIPIVVKYAGFLTDTFPENSSKIDQNLHDKMKLTNTTVGALALVNNSGKEIATVTRKTTIRLENSVYFQKKNLHLIPDCPRIYNLAYVVQKHSVYLEMFNFHILDIQRYGLINKWINDMNFGSSLENLRNHGVEHVASTKVLTMYDLQAPFYVLAAGALFSLLVFLFEVSKVFRTI